MGFKRVYTDKKYSSKIFELEFRDYIDDNEVLHKDLAVICSKDAANVVPITNDNKIVLVKQFRFGIEDYTLEVPGGLLEPNEDRTKAVQRELLEETGYSATNWKHLGSVYSNPVFIDCEIHHFIAYQAAKTEEQNLDFDEEIDIVEMPIETVYKRLDGGMFKHPHTVTALMLARKFLS
jgi:8-oxo-dGTP pyrophosphatase MutT (NUDIX family)